MDNGCGIGYYVFIKFIGFFREAHKFFLGQLFQGWELLVVNGGLTDNILSIFNALGIIESRIRLINNLIDLRLAHARARVNHTRSSVVSGCHYLEVILKENLIES